MPIYKEDFGFVGEFLVGWGFDFWVAMLVKCLILVGFYDMGNDKGKFCLNGKFALFLLDF